MPGFVQKDADDVAEDCRFARVNPSGLTVAGACSIADATSS
jgi:hypothetical protein